MDTNESNTSEEKKDHVLGQRLPEKEVQKPAHLQPEAKRSSKGLHKLLPVVVTVMAVAVALVIIVGIIGGD